MVDSTSTIDNKIYLGSIFCQNKPNNYLPIIKALPQSIILFLDEINKYSQTNNSENFSTDNLIIILTTLSQFFKESPHLCSIILSYQTSDSNKNLYIILIDIYINSNISQIQKETIVLLKILLLNSTCSINVYNHIFRNMRKIFLDNNENLKSKCTYEIFKKYLKIIKLLYNLDVTTHEPKHYIYFNGGGYILLDLKQSAISSNITSDICITTLNFGLVIHMWMYIEFDYNLLPYDMLLDPNEDIVCELIKVYYDNSFFVVVITRNNEVKICAEEIGNKTLGGKYVPSRKWVEFKFVLSAKNEQNLHPFLSYHISDEKKSASNICDNKLENSHFKLDFPININKKISFIILCNNFIGRITNVVIYNYQPRSNLKTLDTQNNHQSNILDNSSFLNPHKYEIENNIVKKAFDSDTQTTLYYILSAKYSHVNISKKQIILNNPINSNDGILISNNSLTKNGILNIKHLFTNISLLGGINNLIPVGEILYKHQSFLLENNKSTNNLLLKYLYIIFSILSKSFNNIQNAVNTSFFTFLRDLMSHFPKKFFSQDLMAVFTSNTILFSDKRLNNKEYIDLLISPQILSKFNFRDQILMWNKLYNIKQELRVMTVLNMKIICYWLKEYDNKMFSEYCCENHCNYFEHKNKKVNDVPSKECFENLILFIIDKLESKVIMIDDLRLLVNILTFQISPCLQIEILKIIAYILKIKLDTVNITKLIKELFDEDFFNILNYVFTIGIYDIKLKIIEIIHLISKQWMEIKIDIKDKLTKFASFCKENIIFDYFEIKPDEKDNAELNLSLNAFNRSKKRSISLRYLLDKNSKRQIFQLSKIKKHFSKSQERVIENKRKFNLQNSFYTNNSIDCSPLKRSKQKYNHTTDIEHCTMISMKIPPKSKQLINYMKNDQIILPIIISILELPMNCIEKFNFFVKILSSQEIQSISSNQIQKISMFIQSFNFFDENNGIIICNDQKVLNWFIENLLYLELIYKGIFVNETELIDHIDCENLQSKIYSTLIQIVLPNLIKNEENFMNFCNSILNYITYFIHINPNVQSQLIVKDYGAKLLLDIKQEIRKYIESKNQISSKNKNDYLLQDYILDIIIYEYIMCYHQFIVDTNKEFNPDFPSISPSKIITKIESKEDWRDYVLFKALWKKIKNNWNIDISYKNFQKNENTSKTEMIIFSSNYINYLAESIGKIKKMDIILTVDEILNIKEINKLKKNYKNNKYVVHTNLTFIPYIQIISNLFWILLKLKFQNSPKQISWFNKYQFFIVYCILLTFKINDNSQGSILESLITSNFYFILDNFVNGTNCSIKHKFTIILSNLTQLVCKFIFTQKNFLFFKQSNKIIENIFQDIKKVISIEEEELKFNNQSNTVNESSENKINYIQLYQNNLSKIKNIIIEKSSLLDNTFNEKYLQNIHKIRNTLFISEIYPYYSYDQIIKNKFNNEKISLKRNPHYVSIKHCELQKKLFQNIEEIRNETNKLLNIRKLQQYDILEVKRKYKALKKSLFSWNNSWSEWEVFYKVNYSKTLKFKVSNYYSSNLIKPFLVPILNIDYYLPVFSKYNAKNLFQNENDALNENNKIERNTNNIYKVELDYDKIFLPEKDDNINDSKQKYTNFVKYLYCNVYDNQYLNNNCSITQNSVLGTHPKKCKKQVLCCIIKQTHHIMSVLKVKQHDLKISRNSEINKAISIYKANNLWDNEKNSCFGNVFPSYPKITYINKIIIPIKSIHMIFKRSYFFTYNSLEFFTTNHKSFFIHFVNETSCMETLSSIIHNQCKVDFREIQINKRIKGNQDYIIGYIQNTGDYKTKCLYSNLSTLTDNWRNWKLSNFDYLIYLNLFSNRSYNDLNQYPVMPWVLKDYTNEEFNLNEFNENSLRDLSLPMGMIEINEMSTTRKKNFIENYKSMLLEIKTGLGFYDDENSEEADVNETQVIENEEKINEKVWNDYIDKGEIDIELIPYFYGTHYSNPMYVNHYLLRLFPYSIIMIEMQGNQFDDPQRLFFSLNNTFDSATTQKCDIRELIPEFFYLPEMFLNINQLNIGNISILDETTGDTTSFKINNVNLPPWCNNNPYLFVSIMFEILNSYKISNLNKWIDLIFGTLQRGKKARKAKNIFSPYSYLNFVNFEGLSESKIVTYKKFFEFGITPNQVYSKEVNNKIIPKQFKGNILSCCEFLRYFSKLLNNEYLSCYYSFIENKKLLIMFTNYSYGIIDFNSMRFTKLGLEELSFLDEIIPQTTLSKITHLHTYIKTNIHSYHYHTYLTYNKGKNIVIGGFFEGNLLLYSKANQSIIQIIWPLDTNNNSPVTYITINNNETVAFCGLMNGTVIRFEIKNDDNNIQLPNKWIKTHEVYAHSSEIKCINHNSKLNIIATSAYDGYVNIYKDINLKLMRSVYVDKEFYIDMVIVVSTPLPGFIIYNIERKIVRVFGLNTFKHIKEISIKGGIVCYKIMKDLCFCEQLIFGNEKGEIVMVKLPFMEEICKKAVFEQNEIVRWIDICKDSNMIFAIGDNGKIVVMGDKEIGLSE